MLSVRHSSAVEPAVYDLRYTCHFLAAYRTCKMYIINIWSMQFDICRDIFLSLFYQFFSAAHAFQMSAVLAFPDRYWHAPVSVPRDSPVLDVFKPVPKTFLSDERRIPVHCIIVRDELIFELCHLYIPSRLRVIEERCAASPAMRIVMFDLFLREKSVMLRDPLHDLDIETFFHDESALPWACVIFALKIDRIHYRQTILYAVVIVIFTESRSSMYYSCTIFHRDVIRACDEERLARYFDIIEIHESVILDVFQIFALHRSENFIIPLTEDAVCCSSRGYEYPALIVARCHLSSYIVKIRTHSKANIGRDCPRRSCPRQEVFVIRVLSLEHHRKCHYGDLLVSLSYFM